MLSFLVQLQHASVRVVFHCREFSDSVLCSECGAGCKLVDSEYRQMIKYRLLCITSRLLPFVYIFCLRRYLKCPGNVSPLEAPVLNSLDLIAKHCGQSGWPNSRLNLMTIDSSTSSTVLPGSKIYPTSVCPNESPLDPVKVLILLRGSILMTLLPILDLPVKLNFLPAENISRGSNSWVCASDICTASCAVCPPETPQPASNEYFESIQIPPRATRF